MVWPSISFETLPWRAAAENLSRRAQLRTPSQYESAVVPCIAGAPVELRPETLAAVDQATIAVTRFDATHASDVFPFIPLLLRGESVASSRIEQLTSSSRKILEAELSGSGSANAKLIVANVRQMQRAIEVDAATTETLLAMHSVLLQDSAPGIAGHLRQQAVWIGGPDNHHPGDALFVPPHHEQVPALLADLEAFMSRRDVPVLAQAAIAHAQLETIHPFADGNGRTGRALVHVLLKLRGLSVNGPVPISAGLLSRVDDYFAALDAYRQGDVDQMVALFAESAVEAVAHGTWIADQLDSLLGEWRQQLTARSDALAWKVLPLLLQRPVLTTRIVVDELGASVVSAGNALETLERAGIVAGSQLDKRTRSWRAPDVLELLDEFAERRRRV
nr:Fic family protein [Corynebacterium imitans]